MAQYVGLGYKIAVLVMIINGQTTISSVFSKHLICYKSIVFRADNYGTYVGPSFDGVIHSNVEQVAIKIGNARPHSVENPQWNMLL